MKAITLEEILKRFLEDLEININDILDTDTDYKNLYLNVEVSNFDLSLQRIKDSIQFAAGKIVFDPEANCTRGKIMDCFVTIDLYQEAHILIRLATI